MSASRHNPLHGIRRFLGMRSAGRRSFAMEPHAAPPPGLAGCVIEHADAAANDVDLPPRDAGCTGRCGQ